jgi:hypothetical protein
MILHPYSDASSLGAEVACYSLAELLAEKIRALAERCRPRDLYDVVNVCRHTELVGDAALVNRILVRKCEYAGVSIPTAASIAGTSFREELDQEWANMLAHQLPHLPVVDEFWGSIAGLFDWLGGAPRVALRRAQTRVALDPAWTPPGSMASWGGRPLDLIRYAGSNRLKVDIDYHADEGRWGWRRVEPYAFRRTQEGTCDRVRRERPESTSKLQDRPHRRSPRCR